MSSSASKFVTIATMLFVVGVGVTLLREAGVEPTEDLKRVIAALLEDGIDGEKIVELPPHERHFVQVIHGTNVQNPDAIPGPVWSWMHSCAEEVDGIDEQA